MVGRIVTWLAFAVVLALAACSEKGPYLDVSGGSFVFNYRLAEAYAGLVVAPRRALPDHSRIEARFEDPSGGPPIVLSKDVTAGRREYSFTTDALKGIVANRDYRVTVRLVGADGTAIETIEKTFRSDVDQSILGDKPLTAGPGDAKNPDLAPSGQ